MEIEKLLQSTNLHSALKNQLEQNKQIPCVEDCFLASPEVAIVASARHDYSDGGGVARYSILRAFYKDEVKMREWQYCDKWSHSADRRDLMILRIGKKTTVKKQGGQIKVVVECIPPEQYSPRLVEFSFNVKEDTDITVVAELPKQDQISFEEWVGKERDQILKTMLENWENNGCTMPTPHGRIRYKQPRIKEIKINKHAGIAVIVTEEQIDCDTRGNPQLQHWAVILKWKDKSVTMAHEEHAYATGGSANIDVVSITSKKVTLGTQSGQEVIHI